MTRLGDRVSLQHRGVSSWVAKFVPGSKKISVSAPQPSRVPQIELRRRDTEMVIAVFRTIFILIVLFSPHFPEARGTSGKLFVAAVIAAACYNLLLFLLHVNNLPFPRPVIIIGDTVLVSLWIYFCGPQCAAFFGLYYAVVIVAGLWFGIGGALLSALLAAALYLGAVFLAMAPGGPPATGMGTLILQISLLLVTAGVVGGMAGIQAREREALGTSRAALWQTQQRIRIAQTVPGIDIGFRFRPAAQAAAGDYYDVIRLGGRRLGVCVGDILATVELAAPYLPVFKAEFRAAARRQRSPARVLTEINQWVAAEIEERKDWDAFITLCYLVVDLDAGSLTYAVAGHEPPVLIAASGRKPVSLERAGIVLGVLPHATYAEEALQLGTGDVILLFTDGVTEVVDRQKRMLDREGLIGYAVTYASLSSASAVADRIFERVNEYGRQGQRRDDMSLLVVRITATDLGSLGAMAAVGEEPPLD